MLQKFIEKLEKIADYIDEENCHKNIILSDDETENLEFHVIGEKQNFFVIKYTLGEIDEYGEFINEKSYAFTGNNCFETLAEFRHFLNKKNPESWLMRNINNILQEIK